MSFSYRSLQSRIIHYSVTIQCCAYDRYTTSPHLFEGDTEDAFIRVRNKVLVLHILLHWIPAIVNIIHIYFAISIARWKSHFMVVTATLMLFWLLVLWILLLNQVWRYDYHLVRICVQFKVTCFYCMWLLNGSTSQKSSK